MTMTDVMVDVETTGLDSGKNAIIQLSAVKFNLETQEVDLNMFNRCLNVPEHREWDVKTHHWWTNNSDKNNVLQLILDKAEDPSVVMNHFVDWLVPAGAYRFWSKPSHFDYVFIESYFREHNLPSMFSYREATDLNSFLRGKYFPNRIPEVDVPFSGAVHNALHDTLHQIKVLFAHVHGVKE